MSKQYIYRKFSLGLTAGEGLTRWEPGSCQDTIVCVRMLTIEKFSNHYPAKLPRKDSTHVEGRNQGTSCTWALTHACTSSSYVEVRKAFFSSWTMEARKKSVTCVSWVLCRVAAVGRGCCSCALGSDVPVFFSSLDLESEGSGPHSLPRGCCCCCPPWEKRNGNTTGGHTHTASHPAWGHAGPSRIQFQPLW